MYMGNGVMHHQIPKKPNGSCSLEIKIRRKIKELCKYFEERVTGNPN